MQNQIAGAIGWVEKGRVPDRVVRFGIRRLLKARLAELGDGDPATSARLTRDFIASMRSAALAPLADMANAQHYELPADFFGAVLGGHRKYSSGYWPAADCTLDQAEAAALALTCERAGLADGQQVLELGCGWGALSLWMAERYPASRITALSNARGQRLHIEAEARRRGLRNLRVVTADINDFDTREHFDRVVTVEMFEHLRNWPQAFANVSRWLAPRGRFFMHVFAHRHTPYAFVANDESDWMSRHFFTGGMMPSDALAACCQDSLRLVERWRWDGTHYQRTAEAWLANMDRRQQALRPVFAATYGAEAAVWWNRWRVFFMAVAELFGFAGGRPWGVSHYLFEPAQRND
ncbi:cyclopropane-fatty-acyl-phospholipid synthase family protein [Variovorax sp. J31P207]|uniref:SAM-dependent methyltransferase n=1 Tax=Variovorax sp. J31P207 TaxID=3053510 RepID=UPI00257857EA|nr:cyclopropane-fatty-acyl-phospholipid synthase family protein [Variovorax sp. J31P207]MDM0068751.1 cyclopropane-fatty-acyl-phospholipid synthase family protein [Variovorax sp. J31P207]